MNQIETISAMEKILDRAEGLIGQLEKAVDDYEALLPELKQLEGYYESPQWVSDYEDQEAGKLPEAFKCGVLSQDGVYDLLTRDDQLRDRLRCLISREA